jgi:hypothetical protein
MQNGFQARNISGGMLSHAMILGERIEHLAATGR